MTDHIREELHDTHIEYDVLLFDDSYLGDYEEYINALFLRDNKLYEYHDTHRSIDGFEGEEEEIDVDKNTKEYLMSVFKIKNEDIDLIMEKINETVRNNK